MGSSFAVGKIDTTRKTIKCPRDHATMKEIEVGEAHIDECGTCGGRFFDQGEMFAALGMHADPSYWDRPDCLGALADAPIHCPRCDGHMLLQTVLHDKDKVEIDRCGHCNGIWLDKGEADRIMAIGKKMETAIDAELLQARADLAKLSDEDLSPPSLIARFLALFGKKK
jgi:Zn-finger nucleic acid-binding protein